MRTWKVRPVTKNSMVLKRDPRKTYHSSIITLPPIIHKNLHTRNRVLAEQDQPEPSLNGTETDSPKILSERIDVVYDTCKRDHITLRESITAMDAKLKAMEENHKLYDRKFLWMDNNINKKLSIQEERVDYFTDLTSTVCLFLAGGVAGIIYLVATSYL